MVSGGEWFYAAAQGSLTWWHILDPRDLKRPACGHVFDVVAVVKLTRPLRPAVECCTASRGAMARIERSEGE